MNPDVLIQNDTWILDTIRNDINANLLYVECLPHLRGLWRNVRKVHTDFFGLKLSALPKETLNETSEYAEMLFSQQVAPLILKNQHRHIPDSYPAIPALCRVNGNPRGEVMHFHDNNGWTALENGTCPAHFANFDSFGNRL